MAIFSSDMDQFLESGSEWISWFNNRHLLKPIENIPPMEPEKAYYQSLQAQAMLA